MTREALEQKQAAAEQNRQKASLINYSLPFVYCTLTRVQTSQSGPLVSGKVSAHVSRLCGSVNKVQRKLVLQLF